MLSTGKVVEDVLFETAANVNVERSYHNFILHTDNNDFGFTQEEKKKKLTT
jgi:hypothetical protein